MSDVAEDVSAEDDSPLDMVMEPVLDGSADTTEEVVGFSSCFDDAGLFTSAMVTNQAAAIMPNAEITQTVKTTLR